MTSERENELFEGMSPASRFIATRRMGMSSDHEDSSKENTPRKPADHTDAPLQDAERERLIQIPPREEFLASPNLQRFSPNTRRRLQAVRRGELPDEPVKTPVNLSPLQDTELERLIQTPPLEEVLASPTCKDLVPTQDDYCKRSEEGELPDEPVKTPVNPSPLQDAEFARLIQTPPREEFLASPNLQGFSPNTRRILLACRRGELTDEHIKTPKNPFENIVTPDSAYGAGLRPGTRRMSAEVVNELNTLSPPSRRESDAFTVEENIGTPDSGFGAVLRPGTGCMSVESRKALRRTINELSTIAGGATVREPNPIMELPPLQPSIIVPAEVDEQPERRASRLTDIPTSLQSDKPGLHTPTNPSQSVSRTRNSTP